MSEFRDRDVRALISSVRRFIDIADACAVAATENYNRPRVGRRNPPIELRTVDRAIRALNAASWPWEECRLLDGNPVSRKKDKARRKGGGK